MFTEVANENEICVTMEQSELMKYVDEVMNCQFSFPVKFLFSSRWGEMLGGEMLWGEMSVGRNVHGASCPWEELSIG